MKNTKIKILCECAVMIALATALSLVKVWKAPLGGSVTLFSMVPIIILALRHGAKWGFSSAFVYSVIQALLDIGTISYLNSPGAIVLCVLLDYTFAFTSLGFACIFNRTSLNKYGKAVLGTLSACLLRFVFHIGSGAVVWYSITKEQQWNDLVNKFSPWIYSTIYNATFMIPEIIITLIAIPSVVKILSLIKDKQSVL